MLEQASVFFKAVWEVSRAKGLMDKPYCVCSSTPPRKVSNTLLHLECALSWTFGWVREAMDSKSLAGGARWRQGTAGDSSGRGPTWSSVNVNQRKVRGDCRPTSIVPSSLQCSSEEDWHPHLRSWECLPFQGSLQTRRSRTNRLVPNSILDAQNA